MALPPPPPAEVREAIQPPAAANAVNYRTQQQSQAARVVPGGRLKDERPSAHAWHAIIKHKHTNSLHSRKQAKLRAKRRARR